MECSFQEHSLKTLFETPKYKILLNVTNVKGILQVSITNLFSIKVQGTSR